LSHRPTPSAARRPCGDRRRAGWSTLISVWRITRSALISVFRLSNSCNLSRTEPRSPSPPAMKSRQRLIPCSSCFASRRLSPCFCLRSRRSSRLNSAANSSTRSWLPRSKSLSPPSTRSSGSGAATPRSALHVPLATRRAIVAITPADRHTATAQPAPQGTAEQPLLALAFIAPPRRVPLLDSLDTVPEVIVNDAKVRNSLCDPQAFGIRSGCALARLWILYKALPIIIYPASARVARCAAFRAYKPAWAGARPDVRLGSRSAGLPQHQ
jgi:hypothetical protein